MKGILILAILFVAIHSLTLTNQHQAQIFTHQNTLNTQPAKPAATNPSALTTTAQPNAQASTQTQTTKTVSPAQPNPQPTASKTPLKASPIPAATSVGKAASTQIKPKDTAQFGNKVQNKNAKNEKRGLKITKNGPANKPAAAKPTGPFFSNELTLTFDYATREETCFYSAHFEIYWNGQKIKQIIPNDYDIHSLSFKLIAKPGKNVLAFAGAGISDGRGATLANIKLIRKSSFGLQDLVENGDFNQGFKDTWNSHSHVYKKSYPGWKGNQIEVGKGDFYNKNWNNDIIVTELDANQNTRIEQTFFFLDNYQVFYEVDPRDLSA